MKTSLPCHAPRGALEIPSLGWGMRGELELMNDTYFVF